MAKINQNQKARELETRQWARPGRKDFQKLKPWIGNKTAQARSVNRPIAARASRLSGR